MNSSYSSSTFISETSKRSMDMNINDKRARVKLTQKSYGVEDYPTTNSNYSLFSLYTQKHPLLTTHELSVSLYPKFHFQIT
ncbi:hypothetical protein L1887_29022 [Cichorium endivia]|nr:hypothetical protein L1887_29022 [Cichorium endivia]